MSVLSANSISVKKYNKISKQKDLEIEPPGYYQERDR